MSRNENRFWDPPYKPANVYGALGTRTVAMSALGYQHNFQWDTHNLYGISEGIVTARAVANITGQRPFVLSRCDSLLSNISTTMTTPAICVLTFHTSDGGYIEVTIPSPFAGSFPVLSF
jgi:hypothetical protein